MDDNSAIASPGAPEIPLPSNQLVRAFVTARGALRNRCAYSSKSGRKSVAGPSSKSGPDDPATVPSRVEIGMPAARNVAIIAPELTPT